jgi:hypothetical protein
LAKIDRKQTLADAWAYVESTSTPDVSPSLPPSATLLVPNMDWRVEHHFRELEGPDRILLNPAFQKDPAPHFLSVAFQFIQFKMDKTGAAVESGAYVESQLLNGHDEKEDLNPDHFHFDRPFLIVMKKRDAQHPFFVMWVDNAELLCKR